MTDTPRPEVQPVHHQVDGLDPCPDNVIEFPAAARLRLRDQLPEHLRAELDRAFARHPSNYKRT